MSYLFTYGTLLSGYRGQEPIPDLRSWLHSPIPAVTRGKLWDINGRYPGMTRGQGSVQGEIWTIRDEELALPTIDAYEECGPGSKQEYLRDQVAVTLLDGRSESAWCYFYLHSLQGSTPISHGDWLRYCRARGPSGRDS